VEAGKGRAIKHKRAQLAAILKEYGAPPPPWTQISANLLWNIPNTSASQISMLGKIVGMTFAPMAACSSFGYTLKLAMNAIRSGEAKAVVIGASDPAPHALSVGAFYDAKVLAHDGQVSKPLTGLRGTHIAGGGIVWILGDYDYFTSRGLTPLGLEPVGVGITADADHIITPSKEGPLSSIRSALGQADLKPEDVVAWDLHATATPGDYLEVENLRDILPESVLITARKGMFGHGMSVGGGWELMAQYMGYEEGIIPPTPLRPEELNSQIRKVHERFVFNEAVPFPDGPVGKLSMGVGGVNACVISKPWDNKSK
ncbi:MAG: beta-ketoacyl synthase N-terminal-like domain-containing protein, partial [Myxococcota bacterium]